jgi:hypothetical protein
MFHGLIGALSRFRRAFGQTRQGLRDPGQVVEKAHARQKHQFEDCQDPHRFRRRF